MHDTDAFNRWEAGQRLLMQALVAALHADAPLQSGARHRGRIAHACCATRRIDPALKELLLTPPSEAYRGRARDPGRSGAHPRAARAGAATNWPTHLQADWVWAFESHAVREGYRPEPDQAGRRALTNLALAMLVRHAVRSGDPVWPGRALQRFKDASNMTDRLGALSALVESPTASWQPARCSALRPVRRTSRW